MLKDPTAHHLMQTRIVQDKPLTSAEEAFYGWFLTNKEFVLGRKRQLTMEDMDEFVISKENTHGISLEEVERDKKFLTTIRNGVGQKDKIERAEIFEAIVGRFAENADWFGGYVVKTLEYDDRVNGVDFVIEWESKKGTVRLGVDVTVSQLERVQTEIRKSINDLGDGHLSNVKYFRSEVDVDEETGENKKLRLSNIPKVVIHLDKETIDDLCRLALRVVAKEKGANRELERTDVATRFLSEMRDQLDGQFEYLEEMKKEKFIKLYNLLKKRILSARERINEVLEGRSF